MASKRIITVVGATGNQGAGVVSALLGNPDYQIRAITRHPDSDNAKKLAAQGVEVVSADINDIDSLKTAFTGSNVIYAITDFFEPFARLGPKEGMEIEVQQGINLARAASATATLEHYIWSTLPNIEAITNGKYSVPHFVGKNKIDAFIRSDAELLKKTTFLWITWYHSNYTFPMFTPYKIPTADKYVQFADYAPDTPITTIGDVRANIGPFVTAILADPARTHGAIVKAEIGDTTSIELLQKWGKATGNNVAFVQTDVDSFNGLWPMWAEEMGTMMRFWDEFRERSWTETQGTVLTRENLGIDLSKFVELETSLAALKL